MAKKRFNRNPPPKTVAAPLVKRSNPLGIYLIIISYIVALLLLLEILARAFIWIELGVKPADMIYKYYPELHKFDGTQHEAKYYDIVFLTASVISPYWVDGGVQTILGKVLAAHDPRTIRIFNLGVPAHNSLDDYYKYKFLKDRKFDLVLFYEAVNDTRANNCPPEIFKNDYSHYMWYEDLDLLDRHKEIKYIAFPFVCHQLAIRLWKWLNHIEYVSRINPKKEWVQYGADIKSRVPFRNNLEKILDLAQQKGDKVLLLTFTYHYPKDYSYERFKNYQLDYTYLEWSTPIEEWGAPANVIKGADVHNDVIRELANEHKEVSFVDMAKLMPQSGVYFRDLCHLTPAGFEKFVDIIAPAIEKEMALSSGI
jgi:hypothetical protein